MERLVLLAGGDVFINRQGPADAFVALDGPLKTAQVRFCNLEAPLTLRGTPYLGKRIRLRAAPANAQALVDTFDVVSLSNNHMLDYGAEGLMDSLDVLADQGILGIGAGDDWETAAQPAVLRRSDRRVGFVAYSMVAPAPYAAESHRPGITLLPVETAYVPQTDLLLEQPGTLPRVTTRLQPEAAARLRAELSAARASCDFLVVSFHWGVAFSRPIADYQREAALLAVEAGAGLIIGHHPHVLQGYEVCRGVPVFYSLGNLAFDYEDSRMSPYGLLAYCALESGAVVEVGGLVTRIRADFNVEVLDSQEGQAVLAREATLPATFTASSTVLPNGIRFRDNSEE